MHPSATQLRPWPAALVVAALGLGSLGLAAQPPLCDSQATITPIGIDTGTGLTLLSLLPAGEGARPWVVEILPGASEALALPDSPPGRYSGSVGGGPVVSVSPCGDGCLQALTWGKGLWKPLGEPLSAPASSSAVATYDGSGTPWLILQETGAKVTGAASETAGTSRVWSYRLEKGEWRAQGDMLAAAVGEPGASSSPSSRDAVVVGSARFTAGAAPAAWVSSLPNLPAERRGSVVPVGAEGAAYLSADGLIYRFEARSEAPSEKRAGSWKRTTWAPGGDGGRDGAVGSWRQGKDASIDIPFGAPGPALDLVWFQHTGTEGEHLFLTRLTLPDRWETLAVLPATVTTKGPEPQELTHVLKPQADRWLLLFGCAATPNGSGLVVRTLEGRTLSDASFLPLRVAPK